MWFKITLFIIQLSAIIVGIYYWKDYYNTKQKYFLFIIIFAFLIDLFSGLISGYTGKRFSLLYNILTIVSFLFYLYWFYHLLNKRKLILLFILIYLVTTIYFLITKNIITELYSRLYLVGTISILACSILYFVAMIKTNLVIEYKHSQRFWLVTGLLIFYIGYLPLHLLLPIIKANSLEFKIPMIILNVLLSGCYIISFNVAKYKIDE